MTGNLLVVVVIYVWRLGAPTTSFYLGSAVILEFSDTRAPVLNHKSSLMAVLYYLIYMHVRRKQRKVLGDCKHILYILVTSLHHGLLRD